MNKQAKVGLLFVFFISIFLLFAFWIKGNPFQETKTLHVLFDNVHGVSKGSRVEYAGLECGKVKDFTVTPRGVLTTILITNPQVKIYEGDQFFISPSSTIASEYQIFIVPSSSPSQEVPDKATIIGQSPPGIQDFLFQAEDTLKQIQKILTSIDKSVVQLSPVFEKVGSLAKNGTIDEITRNITESSRSLKEISVSANSILKRNDQKIQSTVNNLASVSQKAEKTLKAINPQDIEQTISSIKQASYNIQAITGVVEPEEVRSDLKTFSDAAAQVKQISEKLQSPNPKEDVPTLVKTTIKRVDRITQGLESSLRGKTLLRSLIFTKVNIPKKANTSRQSESEPEQSKSEPEIKEKNVELLNSNPNQQKPDDNYN